MVAFLTSRPMRSATTSSTPEEMLFQAEDGIRDLTVTGVQTCALPIFAHGAGAVVGGTLDHDRDPARTVALIMHFLVLRAFEFAGTTPDGALDGVPGHVLIQSLVDGRAQARVQPGIATSAHARGDGDFADQL